MGSDTAAIGLDERRNDVQVRVAGVNMLVDEIGLVGHAEALHVAVGDGPIVCKGELVGAVEVERSV